MKRLAFLLSFLFVGISGFSQTLAVESFYLAESDLTANLPGTQVLDQNGNVCALIKLESTQKGFSFDVGVLGVTETVERTAETWVYVPFGIRKITIQHPQLGTLRDYQIPCAIEQGKTYIMKINAGTVRTIVEYAQTKQFLHVKIEPSDAILEINDKIKHTDNGVYQELLPFGKYRYKAYHPDYHDLVGIVEISDPDNTHSLDLKMVPAFGYLSVTESSQPDIAGALVYVDDKYVGQIPVRNIRTSSGSHKIKVLKELYEAYESTFTVSDEQTTAIAPALVPDFAEVSLVTVSGADIYVNGEMKGTGSWSGRMASGSYIFEARKQGHVTYKMPYDITRNDTGSTIQIQGPTPINGTLVISSVPSEARISIDGEYVGVTPKYIARQLIGEYYVSVELNGYKKQTKKVNVIEGQEVNVSFTLSKNSTSASSHNSSSSSSGGVRTVTSKTFTMSVGETVQARLPEGTVSRWNVGSTNNYFYASGGKLTAKKTGTTSIFGYINNQPKLFEINITASKGRTYSNTSTNAGSESVRSDVKSFSSTVSMIKINAGESGQIVFNTYDLAKLPVSWESDNPSVVSVKNDGVFRAISEGKTTLWAKLRNGDLRMFYIHVEQRSASHSSTESSSSTKSYSSTRTSGSTKSTNSHYSVRPGSTLQLRVDSGKAVRWESEDNRVATVTSSGIVKGVAEGKTTVWAHLSNGDVKMFIINVTYY